MAYPSGFNEQRHPFWEFVRSFENLGADDPQDRAQSGEGVDHARSPFQTPGPQGADSHPLPPPPQSGFWPFAPPSQHGGPPLPFGSRHGQHSHHGPHPHCHSRRGRHGHHSPHSPPSFAGSAPFDFNALLSAIPTLVAQPWAEALRTHAEQNGFASHDGNKQSTDESSAASRNGNLGSEGETITPPMDVFNLPSSYTLHISLPGAKKEDFGVNWDPEKGVLHIAGVIYRSGDEEMMECLQKAERKVGVFERAVKLPEEALTGKDRSTQNGGKSNMAEEVDGDNIVAKLEDGVLVVTVPKILKEKEWVDLKRVDVE